MTLLIVPASRESITRSYACRGTIGDPFLVDCAVQEERFFQEGAFRSLGEHCARRLLELVGEMYRRVRGDVHIPGWVVIRSRGQFQEHHRLDVAAAVRGEIIGRRVVEKHLALAAGLRELDVEWLDKCAREVLPELGDDDFLDMRLRGGRQRSDRFLLALSTPLRGRVFATAEAQILARQAQVDVLGESLDEAKALRSCGKEVPWFLSTKLP